MQGETLKQKVFNERQLVDGVTRTLSPSALWETSLRVLAVRWAPFVGEGGCLAPPDSIVQDLYCTAVVVISTDRKQALSVRWFFEAHDTVWKIEYVGHDGSLLILGLFHLILFMTGTHDLRSYESANQGRIVGSGGTIYCTCVQVLYGMYHTIPYRCTTVCKSFYIYIYSDA